MKSTFCSFVAKQFVSSATRKKYNLHRFVQSNCLFPISDPKSRGAWVKWVVGSKRAKTGEREGLLTPMQIVLIPYVKHAQATVNDFVQARLRLLLLNNNNNYCMFFKKKWKMWEQHASSYFLKETHVTHHDSWQHVDIHQIKKFLPFNKRISDETF